MTDMAQQTEKPAAVYKETVIEIYPDPDKISSESLNPKSKKVVEKIKPVEYVKLSHDLIWLIALSLIATDQCMKFMVVMLTPKGNTWGDHMLLYCLWFEMCVTLMCFTYATVKWGEGIENGPELVKAYFERLKMITAMLALTLLIYSQPPFPIVNMSSPWASEMKELLYAPASLVANIAARDTRAHVMSLDVDRHCWCQLARILGAYFVMQFAVLLVKHTAMFIDQSLK